MRIGITGAGGFIGGYVAEAAVAKGHEVVLFDRRMNSSSSNQRLIDENKAEFFLGDVLDDVAVSELAAHCDGIVHLAACLGTQETISQPIASAKTNIFGSLNVFESANRYDLPVVYAGVGNHWMRNHGTGSYTISKTCAEDYTRMYNAYRDSRISVVRPVNAYGPRQTPSVPYGYSPVRKIMPAFVCRALTGSSIEVYGDGTQISDCVYAEDVARAFVQTLEHTAANSPVESPVEVGPEFSVTVNNIANIVIDMASRLTGNSVELTHLPMRPGEVPNATVCANIDTLQQVGIDASDFVSLNDGIQRTVLWYYNNWLAGYEAANK